MPYAHRVGICDADTHMMEPADWIAGFADPDVRDRLEPFAQGRAETRRLIDDARARVDLRRADRAVAAADEAELMSMRFKGWHGLGAFDGEERRRANDLLGFDASLVFPTLAFNQVAAASDVEVFLGGVRALNRGMRAFCAPDPRNVGVAYLPLRSGADVALALLTGLIADGFKAVMVDTIPPADGPSFTHPQYDRVWAAIQDAGLATTLHVGVDGRGYNPVPAGFYHNGRALSPHADGDAPRDALAYMAIQHNAELFLAAMIFDGVLERFPRLRIAVVELGASWMASWMQQLDQAHRAFRRLQDLSHLRLTPSEYVRRQIKVTPFAGEDIGWMMRHGMEDLLMFASDYPHHEGTDDPIRRFERTMQEVGEPARAKFYSENFRELTGLAPAA